MSCNKYNTIEELESFTKKNQDKKICILLMSGGIDSSTALVLLQKKGFFVIGVHYDFGKTYQTNLENKCCNDKDLIDAKVIANQFNVPFFHIDYKEKFKKEIINQFITKKSKGESFNPCTACHQKIKYGEVLNLAKKYNSKISSGYYCKIKNGQILKPKDSKKDQNFSIIMDFKKEDLKYLEFPLGDYLKSEIREIAKENGIKQFNKKESMGLCFVGEKTTKNFIEKYCENTQGKTYYFDGERLENIGKKHNGLGLYDFGEKTGLNKDQSPLFVFDKNTKENILILSKKELIITDQITLNEINYLETIKIGDEIEIKYNSNEKSVNGKLIEINGEIKVKLETKITPIKKQIALIYKEKILLGGGTIK